MSAVAKLVSHLPVLPTGGVESENHAAAAYADALDRVLEDRIISEHEVEELAELAATWKLSPAQVTDINQSYVTALAGVALADNTFSRPELEDIGRVARLLHVDDETVERLFVGAAAAARHGFGHTRSCGFNPQFGGKSVYFADHIGCAIGGKSITDGEAELLAAAAGLVIAPHLSPAVDIVVIGDPDATNPDVESARGYGAQVLAERVFWATLGVGID